MNLVGRQGWVLVGALGVALTRDIVQQHLLKLSGTEDGHLCSDAVLAAVGS